MKSHLGVYYQNVWLVFITSATVGYGDLYPVTNVGRVLMMFACIFGSFYLGLFVEAVQRAVKLTPREEAAYSLICRRDLLHQAERHAAEAIAVAYLHYKHRRTVPYSHSKVLPERLIPRSLLIPHISSFKLLQFRAKSWPVSTAETVRRISDEMNVETRDLEAKMKAVTGGNEDLMMTLSDVLGKQRSLGQDVWELLHCLKGGDCGMGNGSVLSVGLYDPLSDDYLSPTPSNASFPCAPSPSESNSSLSSPGFPSESNPEVLTFRLINGPES